MKELLEDETLKDLDIKVRGDKIVRCHRYVLAATSSKWEQLLSLSQGTYVALIVLYYCSWARAPLSRSLKYVIYKKKIHKTQIKGKQLFFSMQILLKFECSSGPLVITLNLFLHFIFFYIYMHFFLVKCDSFVSLCKVTSYLSYEIWY